MPFYISLIKEVFGETAKYTARTEYFGTEGECWTQQMMQHGLGWFGRQMGERVPGTVNCEIKYEGDNFTPKEMVTFEQGLHSLVEKYMVVEE